MKKLIATILLIMMSPLSALADVGDTVAMSTNQTYITKPEPIEDELIKSERFHNVMPVYLKNNEPITDEFMDSNTDADGAIKLWARKNGEYKKIDIEDELVTTPSFMSKLGSNPILKRRPKISIEDEFAKNIDLANTTIIKAKNCYDFTKAQIPIQLKIIKNLSTKNAMMEGDSLLFKTIKDVMINGINLPKGTKIVGRVETISETDKMGVPANLVIGNFYIKNHPEINLYGNISKTGANRAIWVYPLYQAGNLILYVAGFVFVPIHGGHAKLSTNEIYTVFYEQQ
jgi:hypothetical protein